LATSRTQIAVRLGSSRSRCIGNGRGADSLARHSSLNHRRGYRYTLVSQPTRDGLGRAAGLTASLAAAQAGQTSASRTSRSPASRSTRSCRSGLDATTDLRACRARVRGYGRRRGSGRTSVHRHNECAQSELGMPDNTRPDETALECRWTSHHDASPRSASATQRRGAIACRALARDAELAPAAELFPGIRCGTLALFRSASAYCRR
jgi:hypothetical protein